MALQVQRQRFQRAVVAQQRLGIEARRAQRGFPVVVAALGQFQVQARGGGLLQGEVQLRQLAVAVRGELARIRCVAHFPRKVGLAVAALSAAEVQHALQVGLAVRRAQLQRVDGDARTRPAAGQVEAVGGEQRLAVLAHAHRAHVDAVEQQVHRRLQREAAGAFAAVRAFRQGHRHAVGVEVAHVHLAQQQRPEAQVEAYPACADRGALAVVVVQAVEPQRADQRTLRLLPLQRAVRGRLRTRQREAQARAGAEQPPGGGGHDQQQDREGDGDALEPLHETDCLRNVHVHVCRAPGSGAKRCPCRKRAVLPVFDSPGPLHGPGSAASAAKRPMRARPSVAACDRVPWQPVTGLAL